LFSNGPSTSLVCSRRDVYHLCSLQLLLVSAPQLSAPAGRYASPYRALYKIVLVYERSNLDYRLVDCGSDADLGSMCFVDVVSSPILHNRTIRSQGTLSSKSSRRQYKIGHSSDFRQDDRRIRHVPSAPRQGRGRRLQIRARRVAQHLHWRHCRIRILSSRSLRRTRRLWKCMRALRVHRKRQDWILVRDSACSDRWGRERFY
jgi:hypothetical protein